MDDTYVLGRCELRCGRDPIFFAKDLVHSPSSAILDREMCSIYWCEVVSQLCPGQHQEMQKGLVYTAYPCVSWKDEGVTRHPWLFMKNLKVRSKQICIKYKISDTVKLSVLSSRSASDPLLPLSNVKTGNEESQLSSHLRSFSSNSAGDFYSNLHRIAVKHPITHTHWRSEFKRRQKSHKGNKYTVNVGDILYSYLPL